MKRVFAIVLTIALVLSCAISSLAWQTTEITFEAFPEGSRINDKDINFSFRNDTTPGRVASGKTEWNEDSVVVYNEDEDLYYAKMVAPQYIVTEYDSSSVIQGDTITFEMMKGETTNGFSGIIFGYNKVDKFGHAEDTETTHKSDYFITEYPAASNDGAAAYAMATGMGFTFLNNSDTTIRIFVRCFNADGALDVIYYDLDTEYDLNKEFFTYSFSNEEGKIVFAINERVAATIEYEGSAETVTEQVDSIALKGKYIRTAKIVDAFGTEIASTTKALITDATVMDFAITLTGEGTTNNLFGIYYAEESTPTAPFYKKSAQPTPVPYTPAPAPATEAPATEAPATEAPATEAPAEKTGCGSVITGSAIAVIALAGAFVFRKKEQQ